MHTSNHHIVMENYYKPSFAEALERNETCCNRNGESKPNGKCSIARYGQNEKEKHRSSDVVTDVFSNITAVRWKDNKVVNVISTFTGKQPVQQAKRYCHREKRRLNIEQPNIINQYNMSMGGVDCMDQNILTYMINLSTKKWWWPLF